MCKNIYILLSLVWLLLFSSCNDPQSEDTDSATDVNTIGNYYSPFTVKKLLDELDLIISNEDLQFIEHNLLTCEHS